MIAKEYIGHNNSFSYTWFCSKLEDLRYQLNHSCIPLKLLQRKWWHQLGLTGDWYGTFGIFDCQAMPPASYFGTKSQTSVSAERNSTFVKPELHVKKCSKSSTFFQNVAERGWNMCFWDCWNARICLIRFYMSHHEPSWTTQISFPRSRETSYFKTSS